MNTIIAEITIFSANGITPVTKRNGAFCDKLREVKIEVPFNPESSEFARLETQRLIRETPYGARGFFHMPTHPNQNVRSGWV